MVLALPAVAEPGDLDDSFGGDGRVTTTFGSGDESANAVVIQADGRIVVAGDSSPSRRCVVPATAATTRKTSNNAENETYRLRALAACASADTKSSGNFGVAPLELSGSWLRLSA